MTRRRRDQSFKDAFGGGYARLSARDPWGPLHPASPSERQRLRDLPVGAFGDLVRRHLDPLWRLEADHPDVAADLAAFDESAEEPSAYDDHGEQHRHTLACGLADQYPPDQNAARKLDRLAKDILG